jgi:hypothetical protein
MLLSLPSGVALAGSMVGGGVREKRRGKQKRRKKRKGKKERK